MMNNVTTERFVGLIWEGYLLYQTESLDNLDVEDVLEYGWNKGWLEEQDILWKDRFIERRNAARIIHEFLRIQCGESDESNWREAEKLIDLYHCKVCAKHVAQVYLKGIMPAKEEKRFQLLSSIDETEAKGIVSRMFAGDGVNDTVMCTLAHVRNGNFGMNDRITTRFLTSGDRRALEILIESTQKSLLNDLFWLPITETSREHFFDEAWTRFLGAFCDGKLVGALGLFLNENEYGESRRYGGIGDNVAVAEFGRAMVEPLYRNAGVMSVLAEELEFYAKEQGIECLIATVHPQNEPSQKVIIKRGFQKVGHVIKHESYERDIFTKKI